MNDQSQNQATDRQRVATGEPWEMSYICRKFRVSEQMIKNAVHAVGNSRTKVENYIRMQQMKPGRQAGSY